MPIEPPRWSRHQPRPQPLPRVRRWSATQRSAQNWLALCAVLFLLGTSGVVAPLQGAGEAVWQAASAPEAAQLEFDRIASRLHRENTRLDRGTILRITRAVQGCAQSHGVSPRIMLAVMIVESNARPSAISPKGAIGLMQVMPHMFADLGLAGNITHIESNIEAGCILLADNMRRLGEDRGISAYFWGTRIGGGAYLSRVKAVRETLDEDTPSPSAELG